MRLTSAWDYAILNINTEKLQKADVGMAIINLQKQRGCYE